MSTNKRYVIGTVTIVGVLGLTAYSIYLYRKQRKIDEESISLEEAQRIVEEERVISDGEEVNVKIDEVGLEEWMREHRKVVARPLKEVEEEERLEDEKQVEEELEAEEAMYDAEDDTFEHEDEGEGKLRYDPNSEQAQEQFIQMELAEWAPSDDIFEVMDKLFTIPFVPTNEADTGLWHRLVDHRMRFFGEDSRWNQRISMADLVLYFARSADFHLNGTQKYWVQEIIGVNEIDEMMDDGEELMDMFHLMNNHQYFNEGYNTYGIFGLEEQEIIDVENIAKYKVDKQVTYDMEFNEFLKRHTGG